MPHINGAILTDEGFIEGHVSFEKGVITSIEESFLPDPLMNGIVVPPFFNAHTHIGDSFVKNPPELTIEELVGPGGYKHRMLESASDEVLVAGMKRAVETMLHTGTFGFADFREGGIRGVRLLKKAAEATGIRPVVLSRPVEGMDEEIRELLKVSDGFGMSSMEDYDFEYLKTLSEIAHEEGKIFAIHFSERVREDVNRLLELEPDFVVHALEVSTEDMKALAEARISVVICPRANAFFGKKPRFSEMIRYGIDVHLGTDNAMISEPNILKELNFLYRSTKKQDEEITSGIVMSIFERKLLKGDGIGLKQGHDASFVVIRKPWKYPEEGIMTAEKEDLRVFLKGSETNE